MTSSGISSEIVDNVDRNRFELCHDGDVVGVVEYRIADSIMTIPHVEVVPALRGKGASGPFLGSVLTMVRERDLQVRPLCSYARGYMEASDTHRDLIV